MTDKGAKAMLADRFMQWVEKYAQKVCPPGCLPLPAQEREISLFAEVTLALRASAVQGEPVAYLEDALRWRQMPAFLADFQIDYVGLKEAIDADLADPYIREALAHPAIVQGEPVAWRARPDKNHPWAYSHRNEDPAGFEIEPLYAHPAIGTPDNVLNEIRDALESRGYFHMANGRDIGILLDEKVAIGTPDNAREAVENKLKEIREDRSVGESYRLGHIEGLRIALETIAALPPEQSK